MDYGLSGNGEPGGARASEETCGAEKEGGMKVVKIDYSKRPITPAQAAKHIDYAVEHLSYALKCTEPMPQFMGLIFSNAIQLLRSIAFYFAIWPAKRSKELEP